MQFLIHWYTKVLRWARHPHAIRYLALVSFTDASFFPVSPAFMLIPMTLAHHQKAFLYAFVATVASTVGGLAGYALGYWAFHPLVLPALKYFNQVEAYEQAISFFDRWGTLSIYLGALTPIPYKFFTIGAGVIGLKLHGFILASFGGRATRFFIMAALLQFGGPRIERWFRNYLKKASDSVYKP